MNEQAIKKIITIYSDLENQLLDEIVRHFNVNEEFINSDYFRLEKLQELGLLNQNIVDYIAKVTNTTPAEIKKALNAIGFETLNINNLNNQYKQGHIKIDPSILLQNKVVENAINFSYNELTNRFVEISNKIETATREVYLNVVEKTYVQTLAGKTYQESIREALLELGDKGITTLTYKTTDSEGNVVGIRNYDVEGTVRRELVTATHNLVNNINQEVAEELDAEYVLLSEHIACRPSHFPWQGMIIKRTQIVEVTGYGEVDGMGGPNCKHYPSPYFGKARGSELKTITQEEAERRYELAQKQRYLERGIRKWKRRERLFKNAEDKEYYKKCKEKVKEWQSRTQAFTSDNNLTRSFSRENVENVVTKSDNNDIITREKKTTRKAYSVSQEQIDNLCKNELSGVNFQTEIKYNSRIKDNGRTIAEVYPWGKVNKIKEIQIGKQDKDTKEFLIDTLLHEKMEAKILSTNTDFYQKLNSTSDLKRHSYINKVITRYFKMKGWNNGNR